MRLNWLRLPLVLYGPTVWYSRPSALCDNSLLYFHWTSSLPVTWQRWRSHRLIRHIQKPRATRKLHGCTCMFYRTGVIADGRFTLREFFYPILLIWSWPLYMNLTRIPGDIPDEQIWTSYIKAFEIYRPTDRQIDRQTDSHDRNYHAASLMVRKAPGCYSLRPKPYRYS